jgi:hypothetical protein
VGGSDEEKDEEKGKIRRREEPMIEKPSPPLSTSDCFCSC